ncbi:hypothetical protein [Salinisphaera orenii]|uniref:hypothetical protein n=1 Tax=Salinisphaera orenii TaxID=856731 RepID=UPI000DBEA216
MHATYYFLANLDLESVAITRGLLEQAVGVIDEYAIHHCDENNGWDIESVVLNPAKLPDSRGSLTQAEGLWDDTWLEAMMAVVVDFARNLDGVETNWLDTIIRQTQQEPSALATMIHAEMPKWIAWYYESRVDGSAALDNGLMDFHRRQLSHMYELFNMPLLPGREPFTDLVDSPYDYRAYDLTGTDTCNAIIRVDIHT